MRNKLLILIIFAALFSPALLRAQTVILRADSVAVPCHSSDTFLMPLRVYDFENVAGLQFTFSWNPAHLDFIHITNINPAFQGIGFDTTAAFVNSGQFTFAWTTIGGVSLPDTSILLTVAFTRIGGPATLAEFSNNPTAIAAIDPMGNDLVVNTFPGLVTPEDTEPPTIACPGDLTVQVTGPSPVNGIAPDSLMDNCAIANTGWTSTGATTASFPNDPDASGAVFNIGTSVVTYTTSDVGGLTSSCSFLVTLELMPGDSLTLIASNETSSCGESVTVYITALNFDSLAGLQFSVGWNPAILQFDTFGNFNPAMQIDVSNFGNAQTGNGFLGFAWTTPDLFAGTTLPAGDTLFSITFTVTGGNNTNSAIAFGNIPTEMTAFTINPPEEIGFLTVNGSVAILDTEPPVIVCPANVSVMAPTGSITATVNNLEPTTLTDNCGGVSLSYQQSGVTTGQGQGPANGVYNAGTTTVTYTAADAAGNTASCSFTVIVDAGTPLTLILDSVGTDCQGGDPKVCVDLSVRDFVDIIGVQFNVTWDTAVLVFDSVTNQYPGLNLSNTMFFGFASTPGGTLQFFGGNAGGWPDIPNDSTFFTICFTVKNANAATTIGFAGTIDAVNTSFNSVPVVTQNGYYESTDLTPPTPFCPADTLVLAAGNECNANVTIDMAEATDACSGIKSITNDQTDDIYPSGVTIVTFTVEDNAGNSATCTMSVTVQDSLPPQIFNCPTDITVDLGAQNCFTPVSWQEPTAFDPCNPNAAPQLVASAASGSEFPIGDSLVTYTATDIFGDTAVCAFVVMVRDTILPGIICPGDITQVVDDTTCVATISWDPPLASDNCDVDLTLDSNLQPDTTLPTGEVVVTYSATDDYGNQATCSFTITVLDLNPPALDTCPADIALVALPDTCGAFATWTAPNATDDCDPDVAVTATYASGSFFPVGTTTVSYAATDASGNTAACSFLITVTESLPPVITGCPSDQVFILPGNACDTVANWTPPLATDNCALDTLTTTHQPGAVFPTGAHVVTYTAFDEAGNTAVCSFTIYVEDVIPPVFNSCPDNITVANASPCGEVVNWQFPTATDNCLLESITATVLPTDTIFSQNTNVLIYAIDASGNSDTCSFTITLDVVIVPPTFNNFPPDVTLNGCDQTVTWTIPTAGAGFCEPPIIVQVPDTLMPGDTFPIGITKIVYLALDSSGALVHSDTFTINIIENAPPLIDCPQGGVVVNVAGQVISDPGNFITEADTIAGCAAVSLDFSLPLATDNCTDNPLVVQTTGPFSGLEFAADSTHTLTFQATDDVGNTSLCVVNVTVQALDTLAPTIDPQLACPGDDVILMVDSIANATYTWTGPQQQYPNNSQITVIASPQNAGVYTVFAEINGCTTPTGSVELVLPSIEAVVDSFRVNIDVIDTINVVANDLIFPPGDFVVTPLADPLPTGLTNLGNGVFTFMATQTNRTARFFYELCSESCPNLCDTVALVTILVKDDDCSFIPNIITPNDDEVNDYFTIPCLDSGVFRDNTLVIYNQWGDKVFEAKGYTNDPQTAWRGRLNNEPGKDLPDGVYFYVFTTGTNEPPRKGFIEIYR